MKQTTTKRLWPHGYTSRTFRFGPVLLRDFYALADRLQVYPSELACYLLRQALDQVAAGTLTITTRPIGAVIDDPRARE